MKPFRNWLEELWRQNCDEHDGWGEARLSLSEYFSRYKWWLRREYRFRQRSSQ